MRGGRQFGLPGQYPYRPNMTVESAVAIAGGFSPRARRTICSFRRVGKAKRAHHDGLSERRWARREERLCPPYDSLVPHTTSLFYLVKCLAKNARLRGQAISALVL